MVKTPLAMMKKKKIYDDADAGGEDAMAKTTMRS